MPAPVAPAPAFQAAAREEKRMEHDPVSRPAHYTQGQIEVIDAIEGLGLDCDFLLGNVLKYVARARFKGAEVQDLRKAQWYLNRKIQNLEKEGSK
jgi:hypothetical protein